jgi:hypothetical protein
MDLTARTILWIKNKGYEVLNFKREVQLDKVKPDAVIGIKQGQNYGILMVEIDRFNNSLSKKSLCMNTYIIYKERIFLTHLRYYMSAIKMLEVI